MPRAAVLVAAVAVCATGCATKRTAVVVLLPDAEGTVGRAVVENTAGTADLVSRGDTVRVRTNERPIVVNSFPDEELQQMFGEALAALPPPSRQFVLNFRFESDGLTEEARAQVSGILAAMRERPVADVVVTGHSDTMGTAATNFQLGLKRAATVRNLLIAAGVDASRIEVSSLGESDPLVRTADEVAEPRNRRVDIIIR